MILPGSVPLKLAIVILGLLHPRPGVHATCFAKNLETAPPPLASALTTANEGTPAQFCEKRPQGAALIMFIFAADPIIFSVSKLANFFAFQPARRGSLIRNRAY